MSPERKEEKSWQAVAVCGESRMHGGNGGMERRAVRNRALSLPTMQAAKMPGLAQEPHGEYTK
jgi:hypothetical protein